MYTDCIITIICFANRDGITCIYYTLCFYGVMSEVGRLPIILDCFKATIGYWHHLENISLGLLKDTYLDLKKSHEEGDRSWFSTLSNMFNVLKTPGGNKYKSCSISSLKHTVKTELKNMYISTWYNFRN